VALLFARFGRWKDAKRLYLLALLGQASHIVLDLLNAYGTQVLQPFSDARLSLDLLFVVDLVFTGIVVAGIAWSRGGQGRPRAFVAMASLVIYVGDRGAGSTDARGPCAGLPPSDRGFAWSRCRAPAASFRAAPLHGPARFATPAVASPAQKDLPGSRAPVEKRTVPFRPARYPGTGSWTTGGPSCGRTSTLWRGRWSGNSASFGAPTSRRSARCAGLADVETYLWFARFPAASVAFDHGRTEVTFYDMRFSGMPGRGPSSSA